jgi:hypothetical protein
MTVRETPNKLPLSTTDDVCTIVLLLLYCGHLPTPLVDGQTSRVYSSNPVQYLYISCNCYVTANKPVLSYLLLRLLPQWCNAL